MASRLRVGFCVSGQGRLFRSAVVQNEVLGIQPEIVIAEYKASSELEPFCERHGVRIVRLPRLPRAQFDKIITDVCTEAQTDLFALTFDRVLPEALVEIYHERMINVHPALLPAFSGTNAITRALEQNVRYAGATIHEVVKEVDAGPIIAQCILGVRANDNRDTFGARLIGPLRLMFLQVLAWYAAGRIYHDTEGRVLVRDAVYGEYPIAPSIEQDFPDLPV